MWTKLACNWKKLTKLGVEGYYLIVVNPFEARLQKMSDESYLYVGG